MHEALEAELAAFKDVPAVLTFQSGFTANTGVIPTITGETDLIVSDALNHASIIDGMRLSKAPRKVYPHADVAALREILARGARRTAGRAAATYRLILVVTDGVFSHGRRHRAAARASSRRPRSSARPSWSTTPTRRASSGGTAAARSTTSACTAGSRSRSARCRRRSASLGGYVAGSQALREILTQRARPFLFSTSHPPAVVAACREAIRVMQDEPELQERLWANTRSFKAELTRLGFDTGRSETPITPVMMGDPDTAGRFSDRLIEEGVFAQPVVFPTVAIDKSRLRTIVTAAHADEQLDLALARLRPGRPRARPDRRVTDRVERRGRSPSRPRRATCRSTPTSTPTCRPTATSPIDDYAAPAVERGIAEIAITDHVDFEPGAPAFAYATFDDRERVVRDAAERWGPQGVAIRFGVELTYDRSWEADIRAHLARHAYDFTIGSVHDRVDSPYSPRRVAALGRRADRWPRSSRRTSTRSTAAARSGLFDAHRPHRRRQALPATRTSRRTRSRPRPELYEPILRALVESGTALEVNTSGLRYPVGETFPHPAIVARFRELGGRAVTIGSDAHRAEHAHWGLDDGYAIATTRRVHRSDVPSRPGTDRRSSVPVPWPRRRYTLDPLGSRRDLRG